MQASSHGPTVRFQTVLSDFAAYFCFYSRWSCSFIGVEQVSLGQGSRCP